MAKRSYTKPAFQFHQIALSAGGAGSCAMDASFQEYTCPVFIPDWGMTVFNEDNCDMSNPDTVCYHVPVASFNVFGS